MLNVRFALVALAILVGVAFVREAVAQVGLQGDPQVLLRAAEASEQNLAKLKSWQGRASITHQTVVDGAVTELLKSEVSFAWVPEKKISQWHQVFSADSKYRGDRTIESGGVIRPEEVWSFERTDTLGAARDVTVTARIQKAANRTVWAKTGFDAKIFLGTDYISTAAELRGVAGFAGNPEAVGWFAEQRGDVVAFGYNGSPIQLMISRSSFDVTKGGSLVLFEQTSDQVGEGKRVTTRKNEVVQIEGVWLPALVNYRDEIIDKREERLLVIKWTESKVNQPVDEKTFTWEAIGIQAGDTITNSIEKSSLKYQPAR